MVYRQCLYAAFLIFVSLSILAQAEPVIVAHRGGSGHLPEHTAEAKVLAHAMGADYLEQDVVLTKDGVPIVLHDIHLDTTSDVAQRFPDRKREDGRYYALDFTLAEIKQLRAHERIDPNTGKAVFPKRFPPGVGSFEISTLEEELQLIQGLNKTSGRVAGIFPEIKNPAWHRKEGHDISKIVLPILAKYGYATKQDPCWIQCFEFDEVKRIRTELGWKGKLLLLMRDGGIKADGSWGDKQFTTEGLEETAKFADGVGPSLTGIVSGNSKGSRKITDFVKNAHLTNLEVYPYTLRADALPAFAASMDDALEVLFNQAHIDGIFTDFPGMAVKWSAANGGK